MITYSSDLSLRAYDDDATINDVSLPRRRKSVRRAKTVSQPASRVTSIGDASKARIARSLYRPARSLGQSILAAQLWRLTQAAAAKYPIPQIAICLAADLPP